MTRRTAHRTLAALIATVLTAGVVVACTPGPKPTVHAPTTVAPSGPTPQQVISGTKLGANGQTVPAYTLPSIPTQPTIQTPCGTKLAPTPAPASSVPGHVDPGPALPPGTHYDACGTKLINADGTTYVPPQTQQAVYPTTTAPETPTTVDQCPKAPPGYTYYPNFNGGCPMIVKYTGP